MNAAASRRIPLAGAARAGLGALAAVLGLYAVAELWLTRHTSVFIDELTILQQDTGLHPSSVLAPFNEHLELARRVLYAIGFRLFGAGGAFLLAKLVLIASVALLSVVLYRFLVTRTGPTVAVGAAALVVLYGSGWELDFVISGIGNVLALAAGIAGLLCLESDDARGRAAASALLTISIVSFSTGLAFALAAVCRQLIEPARRRRIWVALVPLAVYAAWLLWVRLVYVPAHGEAQHITLSNFLLIPNMIAQEAAATAGALSGLNYDFAPTDLFGGVFSTSSPFGAPLALLAVLALSWRMRRGATPLLWTLIALFLLYGAEIAVGSGIGRTPSTVRYTYAGSVIWILIGAEAAAGARLSRRTLGVLAAFAAVALVGNLARLNQGIHFFRTFALAERAQLAALEIAAPSEAPGFTTNIGEPAFVPVGAGSYLAAVRRNGSPAFTARDLPGQSPAVRQAADQTLLAALRITAAPTQLPAGARCLAVRDPATGLTLSAPGVVVRAPGSASILLGQFSGGVPAGTLPANQAVRIAIAPDRSSRPWRLRLAPVPPTLQVCRPG